MGLQRISKNALENELVELRKKDVKKISQKISCKIKKR